MYTLFYLPTCPFCQKVLTFIATEEIAVELRDITEESNKEELLNLGGKTQVPFLYNPENEVAMYESDDIIKYLKDAGDTEDTA